MNDGFKGSGSTYKKLLNSGPMRRTETLPLQANPLRMRFRNARDLGKRLKERP